MNRTVRWLLGSLLLVVTLLSCAGPATPTDTTSPTVTITSGTTTHTPDYTLTATVSDNIGIDTLSYRVGGGPPQDITPAASPLTVTLTLQPGVTAITVTATDAAGNQGSDQLDVTYTPGGNGASGSLQVTIQGLPAGSAADVTVEGPGNYRADLTETATLDALEPGDYTIRARDVTVGSDTYLADPPDQTVTVSADTTAATGQANVTTAAAQADVSYRRPNPEFGSLRVSIGGLPPGAADVTVTGPNGFQEQLTESATLFDLHPGDYTVTANEVDLAQTKARPVTNVTNVTNVTSANSTYAPDIAEQIVPVLSGENSRAEITYHPVAAPAETGRLHVVVNGTEPRMVPRVTIRNPAGDEHTIYGTATLGNLEPGDYTVSGAPTSSDSATFLTTPPQTVTVTAGALERAEVLYRCATVNPPDFGLERALRDALGIASGPIPCTDLATLTELDASGYGIGDGLLRGLQYAINLERLVLQNNDLYAIEGSEDSGLYGLKKLTVLDLSSNHLSTLRENVFAKQSHLRSLYLTHNDLELDALPPAVFAPLIDLENLSLGFNTGTTLPSGLFVNLSKLEGLDLNNGTLETLEPKTFEGLEGLLELGLSNNQLQLDALPRVLFRPLVSLQELGLGSNSGTTLPPGIFAGLSELQVLSLSRNGLGQLPSNIFSGLNNLTVLDLQSNPLGSADPGWFSGLANLVDLDLENTELSSLPPGLFAGLSNLQELDLVSNRLRTLPTNIFANLTSLETLWLSANYLMELEEDWFQTTTSLRTLSVSKNCLDLNSQPTKDAIDVLIARSVSVLSSDNPRGTLICAPITPGPTALTPEGTP